MAEIRRRRPIAHEKVVKALLTEIPAYGLGDALATGSTPVAKGWFCGKGCPGSDGHVCGWRCLVGPNMFGPVIDPFGHSGVTEQELKAAKDDLPGLRAAAEAELKVISKSLGPMR
jgi:hypothetical protein